VWKNVTFPFKTVSLQFSFLANSTLSFLAFFVPCKFHSLQSEATRLFGCYGWSINYCHGRPRRHLVSLAAYPFYCNVITLSLGAKHLLIPTKHQIFSHSMQSLFLPPPRRLCFCQSLFVCLSVCLCVSKITRKVMEASF